ncbi:MAG: isocitrate lyase/phosphoenolpyruvate mutase family protein [Moheibacter sp.]
MSAVNIQARKAEGFRQLHHQNTPLILPNIWNPLGALMLQDMDYKAVATSSSAIAQTLGWPDGEKLPFDLLLKSLKLISDKVSIPVSADVESAYASTENELEENINLLLDTGIAGINYEDSDKKTGELIPIEDLARRIHLIRKISEARDIPLFINARIDTYTHGNHLTSDQKLQETVKRAEAYKNAGADCVFPILITDPNHIKTLISEVDLPLNVMVFPGIPDLKELAQMGVKRISLGGGFMKIALQPMKKLAERLQNLEGLDELFGNEINSAYVNKLIDQNKP